LRRSEKVNAEALLIAAGQNIKRLLTHGHRGPRTERRRWPPYVGRPPTHTSPVVLAGIATDALGVQHRVFQHADNFLAAGNKGNSLLRIR
jgi:hypothetical protein